MFLNKHAEMQVVCVKVVLVKWLQAVALSSLFPTFHSSTIWKWYLTSKLEMNNPCNVIQKI